MSVRRIGAPDPSAVKQLGVDYQQQQKDAVLLTSSKSITTTIPSTPPLLPTAITLPATTPQTPSQQHAPPTPVASNNSATPQTPSTVASHFGLMTERQQLAYLMRATSEGENPSITAPTPTTTKKHRAFILPKKNETEDKSDSESSSEMEEDDGANGEDEENQSEASDSSSEDEQLLPSKPSKPSIMAPLHENDLLPRTIRLPAEYALWSSEKQKRWDGIHKNPNIFYYHHLPPGIVARKNNPNGDWSENEKTMFIWSLTNYPPEGQWGLFSMNIPGRTGQECETFFKKLLKEGVVSQTPAKKNQPAVIKLESKEKRYRSESTPFLVTRPRTKVIGRRNKEQDELYEKELATSIAILSLLPMPGTESLKAIYREQARNEKGGKSLMMPSTPQPRKKEKEKERTEVSEEKTSQRKQSSRMQATAASSQVPPSTPLPPHHSTPSSSSGKRNSTADKPAPRSWGSGESGSILTTSGGGGGGRASTRTTRTSAIAWEQDKSQESAMMDLSASLEAASDEAARPPTTSPAPVANSRKRDASDMLPEAVTGGSPLRYEISPSSPFQADHKYDLFAVPSKIVSSVTPPPVSVSADASPPAILPFVSFTIPAHSPYINDNKRQKTSRWDVGMPRIRNLHQPQPVQSLSYPSARFEKREEIELRLNDHAHGDIQMVDVEQGEKKLQQQLDAKTMTISTAPAAAAAAASSKTSTNAASASSSMEIDSSSDFQIYSEELAKLESSYRVKLRRLGSYQQTQFERIREWYGLAPLGHASQVGDEEDAVNYGRTRVSKSMAAAISTTMSAPFLASRQTFQFGCKRALNEYFGKEVEMEAIQSLLSRCRTYGDAVCEIRVNYKTLLKELQREHTTGIDVLNSLKAAGLLQ